MRSGATRRGREEDLDGGSEEGVCMEALEDSQGVLTHVVVAVGGEEEEEFKAPVTRAPLQ